MNSINLKITANCISKDDIREQIDILDKEIIALFVKRFEYVCEIVKYKTDSESVVAQQRKDEVIQLRGKWAEEAGLDKSTFEVIYRLLIDFNIQKELEILERKPQTLKGD